MKRSFRLAVVLAVLLLAVKPAVGSSPTIVGEISGVELCAQSACGAAIFTGTCECKINNRRTVGFFWVAVQHDELPIGPIPSAIFGGTWNFDDAKRQVSGSRNRWKHCQQR